MKHSTSKWVVLWIGMVLILIFTAGQSAFAMASLSRNQRTECQKAVEHVYWRYTIWPSENPDPKPELRMVMSDSAIRAKAEEYVRKSNALASGWDRRITGKQLQAEMNRMAHETQDPALLGELFSALNNDPYLIAECIARPAIVDRYQQQLDGFEDSWKSQSVSANFSTSTSYSYKLPQIRGTSASLYSPNNDSATAANSWSSTATAGAPIARYGHTAIWTGTQMIIWGGYTINGSYWNNGGRYTPATNSWTPVNTTFAPVGRAYHTAVWTGTVMIVWGGFNATTSPSNIGGRYNPSTDTWASTSPGNVPSSRIWHTAVWNGTQMIVWGGFNYPNGPHFNDGGKYNPSTNLWTVTSTVNVPLARANHTAVSTAGLMFVWGGRLMNNPNTHYNSGGRYNIANNSWAPTNLTNAPPARAYHAGVWTGSLGEMIVWGGFLNSQLVATNTGGRYKSSTNSWTATTLTGAPSARANHTAVWTGTMMVVWGGRTAIYSPVKSGGRYVPGTNSWTPTSTLGAPLARVFHTAVWAGGIGKMIVWGGTTDIKTFATTNSGGLYTP